MAILKEFREMAGPKGRKTHHASEPSKYEYEKHRMNPKQGSEQGSSSTALA